MNAGYRCSVCKAAGLGALRSTDALGALSVAAEKAAGLESAGIADGKAAGPSPGLAAALRLCVMGPTECAGLGCAYTNENPLRPPALIAPISIA